jgi:hypothetical protein
MKNDTFREFIFSIPSEMWENHLPIGKVGDLEIENIVTRKYSHVARCVLTGSKAISRVYVKFYKNYKNLSSTEVLQQVKTDYQTLIHYNDKFKESNVFDVVKPLFFLPDPHVLVTLEASGKTLSDTICSGCNILASEEQLQRAMQYSTRAGAWLRYFQSLENSQSEFYSVDTLIEYMNIRLKILTEDSRRHFAPSYLTRIIDYIGKNRKSVTTEELYIKPSHNDFNLGNIIVQNERVTALDFSNIKKDVYLLDVSRVYHQLYLVTFKPQCRTTTIKKMQKALLEGFGMPDADQLMMFRFLLIRHILTHLMGITRFWETGVKERMYNYWVLNRELRFLNSLLS